MDSVLEIDPETGKRAMGGIVKVVTDTAVKVVTDTAVKVLTDTAVK